MLTFLKSLMYVGGLLCSRYTCSHLLEMPPYMLLWVLNWKKNIQGFEVSDDPWVVFFHCTSEPIGWYKAKSLIALYWKQKPITLMKCWFQTFDHFYYMEEFTK